MMLNQLRRDLAALAHALEASRPDDTVFQLQLRQFCRSKYLSLIRHGFSTNNRKLVAEEHMLARSGTGPEIMSSFLETAVAQRENETLISGPGRGHLFGFDTRPARVRSSVERLVRRPIVRNMPAAGSVATNSCQRSAVPRL